MSSYDVLICILWMTVFFLWHPTCDKLFKLFHFLLLSWLFVGFHREYYTEATRSLVCSWRSFNVLLYSNANTKKFMVLISVSVSDIKTPTILSYLYCIYVPWSWAFVMWMCTQRHSILCFIHSLSCSKSFEFLLYYYYLLFH